MNYIGNLMRPGVSLSDLGWCPGVSWGGLGLSNRPVNLVQVITFTKKTAIFSK